MPSQSRWLGRVTRLVAANTSGAVVVTGASTGIGRATALYLDEKGFRVFAGVRKEEDAKSLQEEGSERLTPLKIDVAKAPSIAAARTNVEEAVGDDGLVGLVNNAGVGFGGPVEFIPLDDYRQSFEVNYFGQIAVTQAFLPLLRRAKGTIVNIASIGGRVASPFMSPYSGSKFALEALSDALRRELIPWGIDVVAIEPGSIATPIWDKAGETATTATAAMPDEGRRLYGAQLKRLGELLQETAKAGIPPERVARVIHRAISKDRPKPRYLVGIDAKIAAGMNGLLPDRWFDRVLERRTKLPKEAPPGR
jgi:NAD(P)-dependent dehydrogenase (short-subunit alcohol dehydrogenase family)